MKIIKAANEAFIRLVLSVIYIVGIGLAATLYALTKKRVKEASFWNKPDIRSLTIKDLTSPY